MFDNPIEIDRIMRVRVRNGREVIKLFHDPLPYPILQLFPSQYPWLLRAGVDPNQLIYDQPLHVNLLVWWREGKKETAQGSRYKDVTKLMLPVGDGIQSDYDSLLDQLSSIEGKVDLLLHLQGIAR